MFHLPDALLDDLLVGRRIEREISVEDVLPFERLKPFNIYIDVMAVDPSLSHHQGHLYAGRLLLHFVEVLLNLLSNDYLIGTVYTVTTNKYAEHLARKVGFERMEGKSIAPGRTAYQYHLDARGIQRLWDISGKEL